MMNAGADGISQKRNCLMKKYVHFDEIENTLASLEMMAILSCEVNKKNRRVLWKWLIVGAHDAIQSAIVCAIADTAGGINILTKKSAAEMLEFLEGKRKDYPLEFMAPFKTLLKKAGGSSKHAKDIRKLHATRNDFVHFTPKGWFIELAGLPRIVGAALQLVEELMAKQNVKIHMSGNRNRRAQTAIKTVRTKLRIESVS
jgi:hypothetical protein